MLASLALVLVAAGVGAGWRTSGDAPHSARVDQQHAACPTPAPRDSQSWEGFWSSQPRWIAGDQGSSVALEDGSVLWLFNDTLTRADTGSALVRNSVLRTRGGCTEFDSLASGGPFLPAGPQQWWWPTHGVQSPDGRVWVLAGRFTGSASTWDFKHLGDAVFQVAAHPDGSLEVVGETRLPPSLARRSWSAGLGLDGSRLLVYGTDAEGGLLVSATDVSEPGEAWSYYDGSAWSASELSAAPIAQVGATSVSVFSRAAEWFVVSKPGGLVGDHVQLLRGESPEGPFEARTWFLSEGSPTAWTYNPVVHPWQQDGDRILVSISRNHAEPSEVLADPSLYRPAFQFVPMPPRDAGQTSEGSRSLATDRAEWTSSSKDMSAAMSASGTSGPASS